MFFLSFLARFVNSYWESDSLFTKVPITFMACETSIQEGIQKEFIIDTIAPIQRSSFDPVMKEEKKDESKGMKKRDTYNFTG
jgi:hypothetical protein